MDRPIRHAAGIAACAVVLALAIPLPFQSASTYVSTRVYAAGAYQSAPHVPRGFPQRQDGSPVRIVRADSTETHVCGTYEIENLTSVPIAEVRFVGVLSFAPGSNRPVQIVESDWVMTAIAPGAIARLDVGLIEIEIARREAAGGHVQAFCALRDVVHENRIAWSVTPNPAATTDTEALGLRWPSLPRVLVGQTRAALYPRVALCLDEQRAEYSPGAQLAIRGEPGKAARCTRDGQWIEVRPATGEPLTEGVVARGDQVALELTVAGLSNTLTVRSAFGAAATVHLPNGQMWGFVSARRQDGTVAVTLHDLSTMPHRSVSTRSLDAGQTTTFSEVEPALSVRLAQ